MNPEYAYGDTRLQKPAKGSGLIARLTRRRDAKASEESEKDTVRRRDRICRWPHCEHCKRFKPRLEVAHLRAKGMGGDHGVRSTADQMVLLDYLTHQGEDGLERHGREIVPLTAAGANGPCEFWATDANGQRYLVAREVAPFVYERD